MTYETHRSTRSSWLILGSLALAIIVATVAFIWLGQPSVCESMPAGWSIIRPPDIVLALAEQGDHIWAGGPDGIVAIDRNTGKLLPSPSGGWPSLEYVRDLLVDSHDTLWIAHLTGLTRYQRGSWETFTESDGLLRGAATAVFEARDGALWIGTEYGVTRYDGISWQGFTVEDGLGAVPVNVIFQDKDNTLWFGSYSPNEGGVSRYDGNIWHTYTIHDGLAHNSVNGIAQDSSGALWFATGLGNKGGASRLIGDTWTTLTKRDGLAGEKVRSVFSDRDGRLWFGSEWDGTAITDGNSWITLTPEDCLAGWETMEMLQDRDGVFWLGTEDGISRIESIDVVLSGKSQGG